MKMNSKHIFCISLLYSLVAVLANLIGVFMPNIFQSSSFKNPAFNQWVDFLLQYTVIDKMQYMSFLLPIVLSISYVSFSGKKIESHVINLPNDGIKQPTIRFLFTVNYISVTLFPVMLLVSIILSISSYCNA